MKIVPILLATAGIGAALLAGCSRRQDNVVIVVIDTLRQDHLATYGYARDTAPFLGELARQGAVFDGLSPTSWTKPAAASLLTGLHPVHHQTFDRWDRLPEGAGTLGERLGREGYQTLAASANRWVSPVFGFGGGFDHFVLNNNAKGKALNRELFPFVDRLKPPFFLYVHYLDPHAPYDPETTWDGKPLPAALRAQGPVEVNDLDSAHAYPRSPEFLARVRDSYDGEIRGTDDALRELVQHLRRRGLMDETILVVAADHGEEMGEHGRMSHGQSLYQEVLRVPLVFHAPHRFEGRHFGRASLLDVAPTVMELLDLKARVEDPPFDGISLAPFLTHEKPWPAVDRRPFLEHLDFTDGANLALLTGAEKIVLGKDQRELYDLSADPGEQHNLLGPPGSLAAFARLAGELAAKHNALSQGALARHSADIDAALEKHLAELGYVNGSQPVRQRTIPRRIDLPVLDWLPWEPFGPLPSCVQLAAADSDRELLQGWYDSENGGRWSERRAALLLTAPITGQADRLVLSGANFRPAPVRLQVKVEGRLVLAKELPAGGFELEAVVSRELVKEPSKVEIETDTVFIPSQQGGGNADSRQLGIFLTSVCYQTH